MKSRAWKNVLLLLGILAVVIGIIYGAARNNRQTDEEEQFSEETAAARLETLLAAQDTASAEVIPMQFFVEEIRPEMGTFSVTAITTMPEDDIADVNFFVTKQGSKQKEIWYEAEAEGNGRYRLQGSVADLGNQSGDYSIHAFITPNGGDETDAGETTLTITLSDYFYSEALGDGRQSLVLVNPDLEKVETGETADEVSAILFKVWTETGGQEDMKEISAEESDDDIWEAEISLDEFSHKGDFIANAYAVVEGKEIGIASENFALLPDPIEVPEGEGSVTREGQRVFVEVPEILQNPELPTGCESVALTIVLNSFGYALEKTEIARNYLPRGDNLATTYVGDPFSANGAGCFPPAIVHTANTFLQEHGDRRRGHNLTGTTLDELCTYIENGSPVILWSSSYMAYPSHTGMFSTYQGVAYEWYSSEHCLVLYGYDREQQVYLVSDPLAGLVERDAAAFEAIYNEIGQYAVVIY